MTARSDSIGESLLARLGSADVYAQKLDLTREAALLIEFDHAAYRAASFLDDRILAPTTKGAWQPLARLGQAAQAIGSVSPVHFIFHTGHVGSTLVSRLLDEFDGVLSLREPLPLRTLAEAADVLGQPESLLSEEQFAAASGIFMRLWGRGYASTRAVVVKATSTSGRMAAPLLARHANSQAIYLNLRAEPYLATLLAGQNSPIDLRGHGPGRMRRLLARRVADLQPLHSLSLGQLAALGWLAETWTQQDAVKGFAGRMVAVDFDEFLRDAGAHMSRIAAHFGLPHDSTYAARVAQSPVLTRYSKAPEHEYSPDLRAEVLRESRARNRDEIARGMAWLERMASVNPNIGAVLAAA
jgi:hypothetical protein